VQKIDIEVEAEKLATYEHRNQLRDNGDPYISHPQRVVDLLKIYGFVTDPEVLAVGWLHDIFEDTMVSPQTIKELFGRNVAFGVTMLTKVTSNRAEIVDTLHKHRNSRFVVVKLADRLSNLEDMQTWDDERKKSYAIGALGILWAVPRKLAPTLWDTLLAKAYRIINVEMFVPTVKPASKVTRWQRVKRYFKKCWRNL